MQPEVSPKYLDAVLEERDELNRQLRKVEVEIMLLDEKRLSLQMQASRLKFEIAQTEITAAFTDAFIDFKKKNDE